MLLFFLGVAVFLGRFAFARAFLVPLAVDDDLQVTLDEALVEVHLENRHRSLVLPLVHDVIALDLLFDQPLA